MRIVLTLCLLVSSTAGAAAVEIVRDVVHSQVLGEDRPLNVALPDAYSPDGSYPVVIALDGEPDYLPEVAARMHEARPDLIVVGVENVDRARDMFPDPIPTRRNPGGGGGEFLRFLVEELIPHVEAHYAAGGPRILSGQSNSAFFVLYAMHQEPGAFDGWLASSPMIGWDEEQIRAGVRSMFEADPEMSGALYLNRGEEDYRHVVGHLERFAALLAEIAPESFRWRSGTVAGAGHVPMEGFPEGVEFLLGAADASRD